MNSSLLSEIHSLLDAPAGEDPPDRDVVEHTLTNGYAEALRLESVRLRIENRLRSVVRGESREELDELTVELALVDQELTHLRGLLSTLKTQALT